MPEIITEIIRWLQSLDLLLNKAKEARRDHPVETFTMQAVTELYKDFLETNVSGDERNVQNKPPPQLPNVDGMFLTTKSICESSSQIFFEGGLKN